MSKFARQVVDRARAWLGKNEADGTHREIIDIYNSHKPRARDYKVTYTDAWCAALVSAVAITLGYTDIIPTECSCTRMIDLFKKLGSFVENDAYVPKAGDIIFYDWDDSGRGDNKNSPDHVGIVEKVNGGVITVIEGNYKNAVSRREIAVNGKYIRGYGVPKYDEESVIKDTPAEKLVQKFQRAAIDDGVSCGPDGADDIWGPNTAKAAKEHALQQGSIGERVRLLQRRLITLGFDLGRGADDGIFGDDTLAAVKAYQAKNGLAVDGIVGIETWKSLLEVTA